jgi:hypothetical protein
MSTTLFICAITPVGRLSNPAKFIIFFTPYFKYEFTH